MTKLAWMTLVVACLFPAIIRRDDRPDARYLALGAQYPTVVALGRAGDATLIAPQWLLTAAHVANAVRQGRAGQKVRIGATEYSFDQVSVHAAWRELGDHDIGLIHLTRPVAGIPPVALYRKTDEATQVATLVGHGGVGTGNNTTRTEDGRARGATSRVDSVNANTLYFSFDPPPSGTDLEGAPGPGDSGGPAFLMVGGAPAIAGISSAGFDGTEGPGTYGAIDVFTRVSTHAKWIDSVLRAPITPVKAPTTSAATLPASANGKRFTAFLDAMRNGSDAAIVAFLNTHFDAEELRARPATARLPNFRQLAVLLRGATIAAIEQDTPSQLAVRLTTPSGPVLVELVFAEQAPNKIVDWRRGN